MFSSPASVESKYGKSMKESCERVTASGSSRIDPASQGLNIGQIYWFGEENQSTNVENITRKLGQRKKNWTKVFIALYIDWALFTIIQEYYKCVHIFGSKYLIQMCLSKGIDKRKQFTNHSSRHHSLIPPSLARPVQQTVDYPPKTSYLKNPENCCALLDNMGLIA